MKTSGEFKLMLILLLGVLSMLIFPLISHRPEQATRRIDRECLTIIQAIKQYEVLIGSLPTGASATVFQTLLGSNRMQKSFLYAARTNGSGEALDGWGTPYQISFLGGTNIVITSAGKNGKFGDGDDYIFDGNGGRLAQNSK